MKNPDWNMAFIGDEDWRAAMSSEVFRNYLKIKACQEKEDEEEEIVEQPLKMNRDYTFADDDYLDKLISEAQESLDEVDEIEENIIDKDSNGVMDEEFSISLDEDDSNQYETGAGDSKFIDIGLTNETMNDIKGDGVMSNSDAVKDVMDVYTEKEIADDEEALGLNTNAAYIFGKGREV